MAEASKASIKEIRSYIRQKAHEANAWATLEQQFGDQIDLGRAIAGFKVDRDNLERDLAADIAKADVARAGIAKNMAAAKAQAERTIKADAEKIRADAERRAQSVDAMVADAKAEADRIVEIGRKAAEELDGRIVSLRAEIDGLKRDRTMIGNDIAALEQRRTGLNNDLDALRKKL